MPQRIARIAQEYAGRHIEVGQPFEVEQGHILILSAAGAIEPEAGDPVLREGMAVPAAAPKQPAYKTRELRAAKSQAAAN